MAARFKMYSFPCLFELSQRQKYVIVCNYFNAMFHANKMVFKKKTKLFWTSLQHNKRFLKI